MHVSMQFRVYGLYLLVVLLTLHISGATDQASVVDAEKNKPTEAAGSVTPPPTPTPQQMYRKLLRHKRATHVEAVNTILSLDNYEKKHKMITLVLDKLFKVLTDSQVKLMSMGFSPGDPFPTNETVRDAFSNVIENTAFFGDLILRLPDIVHNVMKRKKDWNLMIQWGVGFCEMSGIFEENDAKLINLMSQELGIAEKDPNYINPFKEENIKAGMKSKANIDEYAKEVIKKQQKKKQRQKRKGPRLSGRNEL